MIDLTKLELKELQAQTKALEAELQRRKDAETAKARELQYQKNLKILAIKDTLLSIMEHDRTTCSDADPSNGLGSGNGYPRCIKCGLMGLEEWNLKDHDLDLSLTIRSPF